MKHLFYIFFALTIYINVSFSQGNKTIPFPSLNILKMDSATYITNKDLKDSVNTVFINFSPTCDHCENTIKNILQNIQKIKETQFVLTSFDGFATIQKFYFDNGINSFINIFIGQEIDYSLTRQIKYSSFPCLVLFDKNKKYIKTFDEETNAKAIIKALKINAK